MELPSLFALGAGVGFIGGYAAVGGAPFVIIALRLLFDYPQHMAQGTVVGMMLGPTSLFGAWVVRDKIRDNATLVLVGIAGFTLFSWFGGNCAYLLNGEQMRRFFAIFLVFIGGKQLHLAYWPDSPPIFSLRMNLGWMFLVSGLSGFFGGGLGVGGMVLMIPLLLRNFLMEKEQVRAIALAILVPPSAIGAAWRYHQAGDIRWGPALLLFIGYFITNYFGSKLAAGHSTATFNRIFGFIMVISGVLYGWRGG